MSNTRRLRPVSPAVPPRHHTTNRRRFVVGGMSGVVAVTLLFPVALAFVPNSSVTGRVARPGSGVTAEPGLVTPAQVSTDIEQARLSVSKAAPLIGGGSAADARYACRVASQALAKVLRDGSALSGSRVPSARAAGQAIVPPARTGVLAAASCTDHPLLAQVKDLTVAVDALGGVSLPGSRAAATKPPAGTSGVPVPLPSGAATGAAGQRP